MTENERVRKIGGENELHKGNWQDPLIKIVLEHGGRKIILDGGRKMSFMMEAAWEVSREFLRNILKKQKEDQGHLRTGKWPDTEQQIQVLEVLARAILG